MKRILYVKVPVCKIWGDLGGSNHRNGIHNLVFVSIHEFFKCTLRLTCWCDVSALALDALPPLPPEGTKYYTLVLNVALKKNHMNFSHKT